VQVQVQVQVRVPSVRCWAPSARPQAADRLA